MASVSRTQCCPVSEHSQLQLLWKRYTDARAEPWASLGVLWEGRFKEGKQYWATAARREGWEMGEGCHTATKVVQRAGSVLGIEQKFPAAEERLTVEQTVLLHPIGTMWSRAPCAATEEPTGQQWTWLKELQPTEDRRRSCGALCWSSALLNGGPCGAAPQWSSARKAAAYGKSMQDQLGKDSIPWEGPTQSSGREWPWKVAEMKGYGLTAASIQHSTVQFVRGLPVLIWSHKLLFHRIFSSSSFKDIDLEQHGYA